MPDSSYTSAATVFADIAVIRAYEDATAAIGRLDAAARLASPGLQELLVLRAIAAPSGTSHVGMIAMVRPDGEGDGALRDYARGLRAGAARARGGALPSMASMHENLGRLIPDWSATSIDELLRDARERTPPVLKAALAAQAIRAAQRDSAGELAALPALAVTLILCVGGAVTDAWLTLPASGAPAGDSIGAIFAALAREARAAERGLLAARELCDADEARVRESLGRAAYSALEMLGLLKAGIVITVQESARALGLTPPTAGAAVARLVELGIAHEVTGRTRSRAFAYTGIVRALEPAVAPR